MAFRKMLQDIPVSDLKPTRDVVVVDVSDAPRDAYGKLVDANILSAPVWDAAAKQYVGFLDVRDLVAVMVFEHRDAEIAKAKMLRDRGAYIERLVQAGIRVYDDVHPDKDFSLAYMARRHPFRSVKDSATLADVTDLLTRTRCHRVPVVNDEGVVVNVISQSAVVDILNLRLHEPALSELAGKTVNDAGCGTAPVLTVRSTDTILDALDIMAKHDIMGLGIVDEGGRLVANTSASDVKEFLQNPSTSLSLPALDFVSLVRKHDLKAVHPAMSVRSTDTLAHLIAKLAATRVHRLYVVDGHKLQAVVTLTDLLRHMLDADK